jgi:NAD+ kinase
MAADAQSSSRRDPGIRCLGLVVHPTRDIEQPFAQVREWSAAHGAGLVQVPVAGNRREVTREGRAEDCDLIVSIGGDGTMLAAVRSSLAAERPVLGIACGSLGALTSVDAADVRSALDRFAGREWVPRHLPALEIRREEAEPLLALNDIAIVRAGQGQIRATASVDGSLYGRLAGDGVIVSTPVGSSAYALAAGGPLLAPGTDAFLFTPLPFHGGFCPPLVIGAGSQLELDTNAGRSGARVELDGQVTDLTVTALQIRLRPRVATVVTFEGQESLLAGLRRRKILMDSPRILADDARH